MSLLRFCASTSRYVVPLSKSPAAGCVFTGCSRAASGAVKDKEPLKKAKTPQGRFDSSEEKHKDVLQKFPDDVNPETKEKGGPRGPEPTRYGDWERKGRCVDF
ncbi:succinate dehydrogenase assembly factor 4, mitochondrial [Chaetodon auriga]|uniref:succinate dehydrogenase assembly factor 4, mitochondrial n=1 Tax=Chaetodon auriga TaxID=39042 RepID=UPI004032A6CF